MVQTTKGIRITLVVVVWGWIRVRVLAVVWARVRVRMYQLTPSIVVSSNPHWTTRSLAAICNKE